MYIGAELGYGERGAGQAHDRDLSSRNDWTSETLRIDSSEITAWSMRTVSVPDNILQ